MDAPCKLCVGVTAATDLSSRKSASATASSGVQFAAAAASAGIRPILLLHVDQFGICHALHAKARAWYHEYGYDATTIYVHTQRGSLERLTIGALCPAEPDIDL
ncbi:hypothetical protein EON66_07760 [archaeon]|nr:MAG: hypothetical protein EON66_07760 [archaeon]